MNTRGDNPLHILVVAASSHRRATLAALVRRTFNVGASTSAGISLQHIPEPGADVIVVDVDNSVLSGTTLNLAEELPNGSGLVVLIDNPDPAWVTKAMRVGTSAILSREVTSEELRLAVQAVEAGLILLHPSSVRMLPLQSLPTEHDPAVLIEALTPREQEVLRLAGDGLGNKEIAARLNISEHTVKFHISSILGKLGATSRTEAVSQGIRKGLLII